MVHTTEREKLVREQAEICAKIIEAQKKREAEQQAAAEAAKKDAAAVIQAALERASVNHFEQGYKR